VILWLNSKNIVEHFGDTFQKFYLKQSDPKSFQNLIVKRDLMELKRLIEEFNFVK